VTHRLSPRALNRAALRRQLLLGRAPLTALQAVGHLAGLQAQAPLAPYVGLWTRLAGFRHEELKELITERAVLRAHLMRNTVHLVDAGDYLRFRPLYQPVLARHLAGNFAKNLIGVDLAELAATAADSLARRFEAAGITLDRDLGESPVLADPHWLHQVITNLLTNALKFTPSGGRVTISTERTGSTAVLRVTDTGAGIAADDLPRIFDRFFRGQQAAQISGSGIGLAVAAELAQAHGGRLTAASETQGPGHGTQMTLSLPSA